MYCKTLRLFGPNIFAKFKLSAPSKGNDWVGDLKPKIQIYILIASVTLVYYLNCPEANHIKQQLYILVDRKYIIQRNAIYISIMYMYFRHRTCKSTVQSLCKELTNYTIIRVLFVLFFLELSLFIKINTGRITLPLFEKKS